MAGEGAVIDDDYTRAGWAPLDASGRWCRICGAPDDKLVETDGARWRVRPGSWHAPDGMPFVEGPEPDDVDRVRVDVRLHIVDSDHVDVCCRCAERLELRQVTQAVYSSSTRPDSLRLRCDWCDKPGGEVYVSPAGAWSLYPYGPYKTRPGDDVDRPEQVTRVRDNRNEIFDLDGETVRLCYQCRHLPAPDPPPVDEDTGQGRLF
jgi:hypothetical protein